LFTKEFVTDTTVVIAGALLLFIIPSRIGDDTPILGNEVWRTLPWDILLLLAGGFGLAKGVVLSGLAKFLTQQLDFTTKLPVYLELTIICLCILILTEVMSNTTTLTVFAPVLAALAIAMQQNPLLFLIPGAICSSFAFMFPIATPPNSIVFSTRKITIFNMATSGLLLNIFALLLVPGFLLLIGPLFDIELNELPPWVNGTVKIL